MEARRYLVRRPIWVVALALSLWASSAWAYWPDSRKIVHNSAFALEGGEKILGIFTPLGYGINDWISVYIHPILLMLVTPNFNLRMTVYNRKVAIAVQLGYTESFLDFKSRRYPGIIEPGMRLSIPAGRYIVVNLGADYQLELFPGAGDGPTVQHHVVVVAGLNAWIDRSNTISLNGNFSYNVSAKAFDIPTGTLLYAHGWETFRLGVGVAFGRFLFQTSKDKFSKLYAYPVIDVWWRWF
ncbi:MAG: hypothetical protein KC609_16730 [Myxococcales bacterium]|nr:hypothetical protein [Myxococcales bacterium]